MPDAPRVVVVGGSLGGVTAGLVLREVGCDVQVVERSASPLQERGAGIAVLEATVRYLVEHRVVALDAICTVTDWLRYLNRDGSVLYEERRGYRFSSWNTIYMTLIDCLGADRYRLGGEAVGFAQDEGSVTVEFTGGSSLTCDLLVGADGVGSTLRRLLLPEVEPRYAGYVAWRGTVPEDRLSAATVKVLDGAITYQKFPDSHVLVYPIPSKEGSVDRGRRLMNFVWYRNVGAGEELRELLTGRDGEVRASSLPPGEAREQYVQEIGEFAERQMAAPIAEVVLGTEKPFVQVIFDLEVARMAFGRVCLIGDAAFAARPHAAAGTAKAAANAWALAEAVTAAGGDVVAALRDWEPSQLELGRNLVGRAREIGNRSQFGGPWVPGDPSLVFGLYGPGR